MESMMNGEMNTKVMKMLAFFLLVVSIFFVFKTVNEIRMGRTIGGDSIPQNVISVSGLGEVFAVPDLATFYVTVTAQKATPDEAQADATERMNAIITYLKDQGIEDKDIKTQGYNLYPRYEYRASTGTSAPALYYQPNGEQVLVGYEVSQTLEVKVRETEKAGDILAGVGALKADNISSLSFTIDDEDELKRQARQLAITDAKEKADQLAKDLDVKLVRIVNFYENDYGVGYPVYYDVRNEALGKGEDSVSIAPDLPTGENTVRSNVTITYEIR